MNDMPPLNEPQEEMLGKIHDAAEYLSRMEKAVFNEEYLLSYSNLGMILSSVLELQYLIEHEFSLHALKLYQDGL